MLEPSDSSGIISEEELGILCDLFRAFEGALDPEGQIARDAKSSFHEMVGKIYFNRVEPRKEFKEFTSSQFRSMVRNICRRRIASEGPEFLCP